MHGLMNRSLQNFVRDVYGQHVWTEIASGAGLDFDEFEAMLTYDDALTMAVVESASERLNKTRDVLLEDLGTYLVTHPNTWRIRRLLRFGGADLVDFIESLNDLADRARLAVPDLVLPRMQIRSVPGELASYTLTCDPRFPGMEFVTLGCLRAMADDYGALAVVDIDEDGPDGDHADDPPPPRLSVMLLSTSFAEGNSFDLANRAG